MLTRVKFTCVNKLEAMYEVSCVNVKVERGSTFMLKRDTSYITSILLAHVKITRQWKSTHNGKAVSFLPSITAECVLPAETEVILYLKKQ